MPLQTVGKSLGHFEPIIGPITRNPSVSSVGAILVLEEPCSEEIYDKSWSGILMAYDGSKKGILQKPLIHSIDSLSNFHDGDVVMLHPNGRVNTLFSIQSKSNFLFITDRCNSNCLMCSQPPKDRDDTEHFFNLNMQLVDIIPNDVQELGITGGEPTLLGGRLFLLLAKIKDCLPDTEVHMLSNGRSFAWSEQAKRLGNLDYKRLMIGIPLYSDYYRQHDYIVQANNAFSQTMLGLYNLAKYDQRIEIRIVLHKQTIPRLLNLARFINKNLPFVEHIAFMGLEYTGYTPHNDALLWIDPSEYIDDLHEAVQFLAESGMNVSIYNLPLCLQPSILWKYNRKSISEWKNKFADECSKCAKVGECCGLFSTSKKQYSNYAPILYT